MKRQSDVRNNLNEKIKLYNCIIPFTWFKGLVNLQGKKNIASFSKSKLKEMGIKFTALISEEWIIIKKLSLSVLTYVFEQ